MRLKLVLSVFDDAVANHSKEIFAGAGDMANALALCLSSIRRLHVAIAFGKFSFERALQLTFADRADTVY